MKTTTVYLLHFDQPIADHAGHYMGSTADLDQRLADHAEGRGARLMEVCRERGIGWRLVRTWEGDRTTERRLKRRKNAPRLCPLCREKKRAA